jgi:anti-sigma B factor antagonist
MDLLNIEMVEGDPPVLQVRGEIDLLTADQLRTALEEAMATDPRVAVDMGGVTFFDAAGLRVVLQVAATRNGAGPLVLLNAPRVAWVLDLVGLSDSAAVVLQDGGDADGG